MISRRGLFLGAGALLAAPSIVRVSALMAPGAVRPVRLYCYRVEACGPDGPPRQDGTPEDWRRWSQGLLGWFRNDAEAVEALHMLPGGRITRVAAHDTKLVLL